MIGSDFSPSLNATEKLIFYKFEKIIFPKNNVVCVFMNLVQVVNFSLKSELYRLNIIILSYTTGLVGGEDQ